MPEIEATEQPSRYQIVQARTWKDLERDVRIQMLSDWEPLGGVAVDDTFFYQAMVPRGD